MKNVITTKLEKIEVTLDVDDVCTMSSYQDKWYVRINERTIYPEEDRFLGTLKRATHKQARPIFGIVVKALSTALKYDKCEQCGIYKESINDYNVYFEDEEGESYYTSDLCEDCVLIVKGQEGTTKIEVVE